MPNRVCGQDQAVDPRFVGPAMPTASWKRARSAGSPLARSPVNPPISVSASRTTSRSASVLVDSRRRSSRRRSAIWRLAMASLSQPETVARSTSSSSRARHLTIPFDQRAGRARHHVRRRPGDRALVHVTRGRAAGWSSVRCAPGPHLRCVHRAIPWPTRQRPYPASARRRHNRVRRSEWSCVAPYWCWRW
jgi:hypothetical protein